MLGSIWNTYELDNLRLFFSWYFSICFFLLHLCHREEEIAKFINSQSRGIEEFEAEREKLMRAFNDGKNEMKQRHFDEEVEFEKKIDAALTKLMEKYAPRTDFSESN